MAGTDVPSGAEQICDVGRVERAQRNGVGLLKADAEIGLTTVFEAAGMVVINGPAAVGDGILKDDTVEDILFVEDVIPHITAGLTFSGEEPHPVKSPVFKSVIPVIFHVIPETEGDFQKLIPDLFGIPDGVTVAAEFKVPVVLEAVHLVVPGGSDSSSG